MVFDCEGKDGFGDALGVAEPVVGTQLLFEPDELVALHLVHLVDHVLELAHALLGSTHLLLHLQLLLGQLPHLLGQPLDLLLVFLALLLAPLPELHLPASTDNYFCWWNSCILAWDSCYFRLTRPFLSCLSCRLSSLSFLILSSFCFLDCFKWRLL